MNEMNKGKNGITLVTLVITIIIMLILAGVIIATTMDSDGILADAENATQKWNDKITAQDQAIQNALVKRNEILGGTTTTVQLPAGWDSSKVADVVEEKSTNRKAPIPVGYKASQISTEDEISEGLVIYQTDTAVTGEPNSQAHIAAMEGINQYVWIPVDDINDMVMCKSNGNNKKTDGTATTGGKTTCELVYDVSTNHITCNVHGYTTATALTDSTIDTTGLAGRSYSTAATTTDTEAPKIYTTSMDFTDASKVLQKFSTTALRREPDLVTDYDNSNYQLVLKESTTEPLTSANELNHQLNNKFIEMARSVAKYGGFYISRFEPSYENDVVISKKNKAVLTATTTTSGNKIAGDNWYELYNKTLNSVEKDASVNSHMIWGCQYDQVIKFLGKEKGETGHTYQTTSQQLTGYADYQDILNNIYDLEGNNCEWTALTYRTSSRAARGCSYPNPHISGLFYPASFTRENKSPTDFGNEYTTRPMLTVAL